ncbi:MAG TPA: polysaccharide biosynthesis/export family protein [Chitinophagaceae bacterium]|jgi:polysaccharide export outer membrane protein|nr:polysaccharide biosynthesis/export family protein [Chitinophagaceae bacterium]
MKFTWILLLLIFPLCFVSCKMYQRLPNYLEHVNDTTGKGVVKIPELRIQKGDLLSIQINSLSTEPKADEIYNLPITNTMVASQGQAPTVGFLVDNSGDVEHFRLGSFHAEGLTKHELAAAIKKRLTEPVELLRNPTITIRFLNFRVTILGEVAKEGQVTVPGERLTILEAVGLAGGIKRSGKKEYVKVMREINGQRETGLIDLSSKDFFESPYYNLMQNDVVVVIPNRQGLKDEDQQRAFQKISMGLTLVSAAALLSNIFIKN